MAAHDPGISRPARKDPNQAVELLKVASPIEFGEPTNVQQLLAPLPVQLDGRWGFDHGTWSVLCHVYPHADIPIVQLSIDETQPPSFHYENRQAPGPVARGRNPDCRQWQPCPQFACVRMGRHAQEPYDWAISFEKRVREWLLAGQHNPLIDYENKLGREAVLAAPTPDHYLPLLYVMGAGATSERVSFPVEGVDGGSISMLAVQVG